MSTPIQTTSSATKSSLTLPSRISQRLSEVPRVERSGRVLEATHTRATLTFPGTHVGGRLRIVTDSGEVPVEVESLNEHTCQVRPLCRPMGIRVGQKVLAEDDSKNLEASARLCGACWNHEGHLQHRFAHSPEEFETLPRLYLPEHSPVVGYAERPTNYHPLLTGSSRLDFFTTIATGQRIAVIAPPGVGKSRLVYDMLESNSADICVLALIGERGREITELLQRFHSNPIHSRTVVVAAASDNSADNRSQAAETALRYTEYFRECGLSVLLIFDSLTRLVRAWREVALKRGEAIARGGYPASVFEKLAPFLERVGLSERGSSTGIFTLLQPDELFDDPIIEEVKSILDGHIYLSKVMAEEGMYPAVDVSRSLSRLQSKILTPEQESLVLRYRAIISRYTRQSDLIKLSNGAHGELKKIEEDHGNLVGFFNAVHQYTSIEELFSQAGRVLE